MVPGVYELSRHVGINCSTDGGLQHHDSHTNRRPLRSLSCCPLESNSKKKSNDGYIAGKASPNPNATSHFRAVSFPTPPTYASSEPSKKRQPSKTTNTFSSKHTNEISIHIYKHIAPGICVFPAPVVRNVSCTSPLPKPILPINPAKNGPRHPQPRRRYYIPPARPHLVSAHAHTRPTFATARRGAGMHRHSKRPLLSSLLGRTSTPSSYAPVRAIRQTRHIYPDRPFPSRPRECVFFGVVTI